LPIWTQSPGLAWASRAMHSSAARIVRFMAPPRSLAWPLHPGAGAGNAIEGVLQLDQRRRRLVAVGVVDGALGPVLDQGQDRVRRVGAAEAVDLARLADAAVGIAELEACLAERGDERPELGRRELARLAPLDRDVRRALVVHGPVDEDGDLVGRAAAHAARALEGGQERRPRRLRGRRRHHGRQDYDHHMIMIIVRWSDERRLRLLPRLLRG